MQSAEGEKTGKNKSRSFLCCAEGREDDCNFFEWPNPTPQQPPLPLNIIRAPGKTVKSTDNSACYLPVM